MYFGNVGGVVRIFRNFIDLSGLQAEQGLGVEFSGVLPDEEAPEDLNLRRENLTRAAHPRIRSLINLRALARHDQRSPAPVPSRSRDPRWCLSGAQAAASDTGFRSRHQPAAIFPTIKPGHQARSSPTRSSPIWSFRSNFPDDFNAIMLKCSTLRRTVELAIEGELP